MPGVKHLISLFSSHAGRQVDGAVGSLDQLPAIVDAVGEKVTVPCCTILVFVEVLMPSRHLLWVPRLYCSVGSVIPVIESIMK